MLLVSVIIPCYNAAPFLRQTLTSVLAQTGVALRVIVVDDGSTDDSAEIVMREFPAFELIRTSNQGAGHARNCGLERARGDYYLFLDADDVLFDGTLARQAACLDGTGADVVYGEWQSCEQGSDGQFRLGKMVTDLLSETPDCDLVVGKWRPSFAYLFRRSIVERVGTFRLDLPIVQDARWALDCALYGAQFIHCPGVCGAYRSHSAQLSRNRIAFLQDCLANANQVQAWWSANGSLGPPQHAALVQTYGQIARASYAEHRPTFCKAYAALLALEPHYVPRTPRSLNLMARMLGYPRAEAMAALYRRVKPGIHIVSGRS